MSLSLSHVPVPVWIIRCSPQAHAHHALLTPQALMLKALVHAHAHALLSSTLTHAHGSPQWLMISHAQSLSLSRSSCISRNPILYIPASGDFCFTSDSRTKNDFRQARSLTPPKRTFHHTPDTNKNTIHRHHKTNPLPHQGWRREASTTRTTWGVLAPCAHPATPRSQLSQLLPCAALLGEGR